MSGLERMAAKVAASERIIAFLFLGIGIGFILQANQEVVDSRVMIGEIAAYVNIVAYIPYFISTLRGETKPSKVTWWIWTAFEILLIASYIMSGANNTKWLPIAALVGMLITAILSLRYGKRGWTIIDTICSVGSIVGIAIWIISGSPVIAMCSFLIVDFLAAIPTMVKSWHNPEEENAFTWAITFASGLINLFAIEKWTFEIVIYPLHLVLLYGMILYILLRKRR